MARELDALPGGEIQKNLPPRLLDLLFDDLDFVLETDAKRMFLRVFAEAVQLVLQFNDGFFEVELMLHALEF
jgi:hypothetical protein